MSGKLNFRDWLDKKCDFSPNVVGDVISRAKRAHRLIKIRREDTDVLLALRLSRNGEFTQMKISVKSQLKRAARLYRDYLHLV